MNSPPNIADQMPLRRFEYKDDRSYKFWAIELDGDVHRVTFGRIGTKGQMRTKQYDGANEAKRQYEQRIDEKLKAGYREVKKKARPKKTAEEIAAERAPHEPFLEAIIAAEDDDLTPHLIYSDWLTERGDPLGEFIQVQIQLEDPNLPLYRRPELEKQETQLLARHVRGWLGELSPFLIDQQLHGEKLTGKNKNYEFDFRRGQLYSVDVNEFDLLFGAALRESHHCRIICELRIRRLFPIARPVVVGSEYYEANQNHQIATLVGAPLESLRALRFGDDTFPLFLRDASPVLLAPMRRLRMLEFSGDYDPKAFVLHLPRLTSLRLGMGVFPDEARRLASSGLLDQLYTLDLRTGICQKTAEVLCESAIQHQIELIVPREETPGKAIEILRGAGFQVRFSDVID